MIKIFAIDKRTIEESKVKFKADYIFDMSRIRSNRTKIKQALLEYINSKNIDILFYNFTLFHTLDDLKEIINTLTKEQADYVYKNIIMYIAHSIKNYNYKQFNKMLICDPLFRFSYYETDTWDTLTKTCQKIFNVTRLQYSSETITKDMFERVVINYENFMEKEAE